MSSSPKSPIRRLKDLSFFIRDTYSHTINLQQSLLGEVTLGTIKKGKKITASDEYKSANEELTNDTNGTVPLFDEKHVIKQWDKSLLQQLSDRVLENPLMEIELMQHLCTGDNCHPYFVKLICAFEDHSSYCTTLEYVPGGDLCNYVQLHGALEYERARRYARQITLAVNYLHKHGYCHLDLSLENILLDEEKDLIKLCDFGLCRKLLPDQKPFEASTVRPGKKSYIAPEIYSYSSFCGDKADIFSLGVIYFIMLCGFPPFHKPDSSDPCFRFVFENDISLLVEKWQLTNVITPECCDLLNKIFVSEDKRINISDLLAHPFWEGVQLADVNAPLVSDLEIKEKTGIDTITDIRDTLPPEVGCSTPPDHSNDHETDGGELRLMPETSNGIGDEENEMKYANEETDEDNPPDSRHIGVGSHYPRRRESESQFKEVEIRKRTSNASVNADKAIVGEVWNSEIQSDNE